MPTLFIIKSSTETGRQIIKIIFSICLVLNLTAIKSQNENGLENIIVEKYYISGANDTTGRLISGFLPIGSTTYRIYLDMLPGYRFYTAYGNENHELRIETTTKFFNNEDIGNKVPNVIPRRTMARNTVMLDSWLSGGGAGEDYYGVLKEDDDTLETIVHEKPFLQNTDKRAGIPVKYRDGLVSAHKVPFPHIFGLDEPSNVFFSTTNGSSLITKDGGWGCLGGSTGLDSLASNRLLIAQLTTDGDLSFELNLQIGKRGERPQFYVAKNVLDGEYTLPSLTYETKKETGKKTKPIASKKTNTTQKK